MVLTIDLDLLAAELGVQDDVTLLDELLELLVGAPRALASRGRSKPTMIVPLTSMTGTPCCPVLRVSSFAQAGFFATSSSRNGTFRSFMYRLAAVQCGHVGVV